MEVMECEDIWLSSISSPGISILFIGIDDILSGAENIPLIRVISTADIFIPTPNTVYKEQIKTTIKIEKDTIKLSFSNDISRKLLFTIYKNLCR
jgi:hypothetical protein